MKTLSSHIWRQGRPISNLLCRFFGSERGIVSIEWVAIAAVLAAASIAIAGIVMTGLATPAGNIANQLSP